MAKVRGRSKKNYCRHRIAKLLYGVLELPLTLIVAQTGYGKTSSLQAFLSRRKDIGVISLDMSVELFDESLLWSAFCHAVSDYKAELGESLRLLGAPQNEMGAQKAALQFLAGMDGLNVLVIDDYSAADGNARRNFERFLTAIVRSVPQQLRVVLLDRRFPPFLNGDWFYSESCGVIDQLDLAYTREEIAEHFAANASPLSESETAKAEKLAGGWPVAVELLCEEYQRTGLLRQTQESVQFVRSNCLEKMGLADQRVLAQLSVLDSFTLEQAAYITQNRKIRYQLIQLCGECGFLDLDMETGVYRMHPLMRAAARELLERNGTDPDPFYFRCASWYDTHDDRLQALRYYRLTESSTRILELLGEPYATEIVDQDPVAVHQSFPSLAARSRRKYALAVLVDIYAQMVYLNREEGIRQLEEMKGFLLEPNKKANSHNPLQGELSLLESLTCIDDLDKLQPFLQNAAVHFEGTHSVLFSRQSGYLFGSPSILWRYHKKPGALQQTVEQIGEVFRDMSMLPGGALTGAVYLARAEMAYYMGRFEDASLLAYQAIYMAKPKGQKDIENAAVFVLARVSITIGEYDNACSYLGELRHNLRQSSVRDGAILPGTGAAVSYISSCMGETEPMDADQMIPNFNGFIMKIVEGKRLLQQKYDIQLEMFAENMLCESNAGVFEYLYGYLYLAVAKERLGEASDADKALERAARLAQPDGLVMAFVENAPYLAAVMSRSGNPFIQGILPRAEEFCKVLEQFKELAKGYSLSPTELQIVRWYAGGCKQGEVARNLNLSVTEVRRTINDIYRKIGIADIGRIAEMILR